jgi:predicted glycosyltransferase
MLHACGVESFFKELCQRLAREFVVLRQISITASYCTIEEAERLSNQLKKNKQLPISIRLSNICKACRL